MATRRYYKEVSFDHLCAFCATARRGSFAAAGAELGLSRTTVWQQIDTVERDLGVKLFARAGRGVALTADGRLFLELVQPAVAAVESVRPVFRARRAAQAARLRIASVERAGLFPSILRFRREFPHVHVTLIERRSVDAVRAVEEGQCDLGLALWGPDMARSPAVHYEPIARRDFMVVAPRQHPLLRARRLRLADLAACPLVTLPQDNPLRRHIDRAFERAGLLARLEVVVESDGSETVEECVRLGLGVALALVPPRPGARAALGYRSAAEHLGSLPLCLLWKKGAHLLPHVAAFVGAVKASQRD